MNASLDRFELPLARPLVTASGTIDQREGFVVDVAGEDGHGVGEATPMPTWTESVGECLQALEGAVETLSADRDRAFQAVADRPAARHGLSLALTDLEAQQADVSVATHLTAEGAASSVPVNATVGDGGVEETVESALAMVAEGYDCIKVKVGARSPGVDAARLRAVGEEAPENVSLRVDANGSWSLEEARTFLDRAPPLEYVEQPLDPEALEAHASLPGETTVALDETLREYPLEEILASDVADVLILKPMVLGGLDRALETADAATDAGIDVVVSTTIDGVLARTGAVHLAAALDCDRACGVATGERLLRDLGPDPCPVRDGQVPVPDGPGLGVSID